MHAGPLPVRYRDASGAALISVTQVLSLANRINTDWYTPESAWRGSEVHRLTELVDRGEPLGDLGSLAPYLDAYRAFLRAVQPKYEASEVEVSSARLQLAGRVDRICSSLFGSPGLVDFKTGPPQSWHGAQLAAYNVLRPTGARWGVYLEPTGRFKIRQYDDPADHRRFMFDLAQTRGTVMPDGDHWVAAA